MAKEGTFIGELQRGWARFWHLSWWWKGPVLGIVAFVVLVGIAAAAGGGGEEDKSDEAARATERATAVVTEEATRPPTLAPTPQPVTPSPTPAPTPAPTPNKAQVPAVPGAVAELHNVRVTMHSVIDPYYSGNQFIQPEVGGRFVAVDAEIELLAAAGRTHYACGCGFALTDTASFTFESGLAAEPEPRLDAVDLRPGERTRGWVGFEVSGASVLSVLRYQPDFIEGDYIEFKFQ
jgi:hypothetical protein